MFAFRRSLITLQADLRSPMHGQIALAGISPWVHPLWAELAPYVVVRNSKAQAHGKRLQWDDSNRARAIFLLASHDDVQLSIHQFLTDLDHVAVVIIPDQIDLLVLFGRPMLDLHGDFDFPGGGVRNRMEEHVPGVVGGSPHIPGLNSDLQRAVSHPPAFPMF